MPAGGQCTDLVAHLNHPSVGSAQDASPGEPLDVAALTRRMVQGDEMAYRIFYDAYFDRLSRYLLVVAAGNEEAMREALQATLVRVVRYLKEFRNEEVFWSWLTVLARSAFTDETRKRRRYFSFLDRFRRLSGVEPANPNDPPGEERLQTLLERQVASLPPDERELIQQKYFARRSVREIAVELQTTEKAVESKLSRIRRKLKETVLAELHDESRR